MDFHRRLPFVNFQPGAYRVQLTVPDERMDPVIAREVLLQGRFDPNDEYLTFTIANSRDVRKLITALSAQSDQATLTLTNGGDTFFSCVLEDDDLTDFEDEDTTHFAFYTLAETTEENSCTD